MVLNIIRVKKADKPKVLSYQKILNCIENCKNLEGDIHDKEAYEILSKELERFNKLIEGHKKLLIAIGNL